MSEVLLETADLSKRFNGLTAVDSVDYEIQEGETTSLIGPNGAGKTTFFNLISGTLAPTSGTITFRGEDITDLDVPEVSRMGIGRSFQITNLFDGLTVLENIRLGIQSVERSPRTLSYAFSKVDEQDDLNREAREIIEFIGLEHLADEKVETLSHGDKRVIELGLTLSLDADLILLDEPVAGLNTNETRELLELIRRIGEDKTVLVIEHDVEFVIDISDTISVLHQGRVLARGTPDEIRNDDRVREVYLGEA